MSNVKELHHNSTYNMVEVLYHRDEAFLEGKEEGIKAGIAYAVGLFSSLATQAMEECLDRGDLGRRNEILKELVAKIYEEGRLTREDEYETLVVKNIIKGIWTTPYPNEELK